MKKHNLAIIGAVFTALFSTLCCLPAFLFLFFGITSGFLVYLTSLEFIRVPLAILSILFMFLAFLYLKKNSSCKHSRKMALTKYIMLFSLFCFILLVLFYPEILPLIME